MSTGTLLTCDVVCWGVASPGAFQDYLVFVSATRGGRVAGFSHRAKSPEWRGTRALAIMEDGTRVHGDEAGLWGRLWYGRLCRPSCNACGYHSTARASDVTIGDFWGIEDWRPELEDALGVSCLLASTERGLRLVRSCSEALSLALSDVASVANESQPMLLHPPRREADREDFWRSYASGGFESAADAVGQMAGRSGLKGMARRALRRLLAGARRLGGAAHGEEDSMSGGWDGEAVDFESLIGEGKYPVAFAAKNRSDAVRVRSSSGGVFHALAGHVIAGGGVVYGCAFDERLRATHIRCDDMAGVERCMGSKYSQSRMGDSISRVRDDLEAGLTVLFTGTPCQVAAVRAACSDLAGG